MPLNAVRILVVDDNDAGRYVKAHTLRSSGFIVSEASSGAEAVARVAEEPPGLIVLDVKLPDISGIDLCRRFKRDFPAMMVLQTSAAFVGSSDRAAGLQGGADSYLVEPIDPPELVAAVHALLRTRKAEIGLRRLNQQLEQRVSDRTAALEESNRRLQAEIEERRRTETALRLAEKMELVGQLTGGIAHDFNNLLTVIAGNLELLHDAASAGEPLDPARLARRIATAQNATQQAARLTRRLLVLSRRDDPRPVPARLGRIVAGLEEFLRRSLGERISLELSIDPDGWSCRIDEVQFETAVLNLAVNARDAMPGGGHFAIRTQNVRIGKGDPSADIPPGEYVLLNVSDTGAGMDPEVLEHAFEPFFTTKEVGKGSGLGLSQVHSFVAVAGGHLKVDSTPGLGTRFSLYFPRSREEERRGPYAAADETIDPGEGQTILVVEDDPDVLDIALKTIGMLGYDVTTAPNGPQALAVLRSGRRIDLLFTDVVMPDGINGYELAAAARAINPEIKVLLTSGYSAGQRPKHDPMLPILNKPYTRNQLAASLRAALDQVQDAGEHAAG